MSEQEPTLSVWYDSETGWNLKFHAPMFIESAVIRFDALELDELLSIIRQYCLLEDMLANRRANKTKEASK